MIDSAALAKVEREVVRCERCPRLRAYCAHVAAVKRKAFLGDEYWGRPLPSFGDPEARLLIVGLAPAAHGGNRTGRMFTGDQSGDFLFRSLFETGFASQPESRSRDDGLALRDCYITAIVRCAPPDNRPKPEEIRNCREYLERELDLLGNVKAVVALGRLPFEVYLSVLRDRGIIRSRSAYPFGHNCEHTFGPGRPVLIASYHPSQQNTFTGRLTPRMLNEVFERARRRIATASSREKR